MYDPIMRVLTVLEILQAREQVSGSELARRLEVSPRTVQRYIARLQDLCIPVEATRGVDGAYRLKSGFRLPPLMFTDEEAFAISLGLRALRHLGLSAFAPAAEGASAKLGRLLPAPVKESVHTVEEVIALEPGPWTISTPADSLIRVAVAIRARRRLSFDYRSHGEVASHREIEPYGVLHLDGRWYVVGRCLLRQALRTFRLDRISSLEQSEAAFIKPDGFDIKQYLQRALPFVQSAYTIEVWIDMPHSKAETYFAPWRVITGEEDGGTILTCGRDDLHMFAAMLLSFGCRVVVRQPEELRKVFTQLAKLARQAAETPGERTPESVPAALMA
ncbi:MAG TPA: YafY family protein [Bryobacteraceae bacterium]|jgi:predicted DNA-binding transcriptional regulator YafY|nr:YafY family protein [Bryobacteraceae bacterium]